jgi:hypothetical protein
MAKRRMFSLKVIDTDNFLEMSVSARELYFQFGMRADDDGIVGNPRKIMKMVGASDDDFRVLIAKKFVIPMSTNGVCVITHWRVNNFIRPDRYEETEFKEEKGRLSLIDGKYSFDFTNKVGMSCGIPDGIPSIGQVRLELGKVRLPIAAEAAEVIPDLLKDKQKHVQIIGLWARAKKVNFTSKEQQRSFIRRNARPAINLSPYNFNRITEVMAYLIKKADFKVTLETVGKYIDEDLSKIKTKGGITII